MPVFKDCLGAFEAGDEAYGLQFIKPGFCRTPMEDRLFALGFPNIILPTDDKLNAKKIVSMNDFNTQKNKFSLGSSLPRGMSVASVNAVTQLDVWRRGVNEPFPWDACTDSGVLDEGLLTEGNPDVNEAWGQPHHFARLMQTGGGWLSNLYILEAVFGTRAVINVMLDWLETLPAGNFQTHDLGYYRIPFAEMHFLLLRLSTADRLAAISRLQSLFSDIDTANEKDWYEEAVKLLDVALNGRAGVERSGYRPDNVNLNANAMQYIPDDPDWVDEIVLSNLADQKPSDWPTPDARLVFLGSEKLLVEYCAKWKTFRKQDRKKIVAQFGRIHHPAVWTMISEMATQSGAKREAAKWIKENPEPVSAFVRTPIGEQRQP